MKCPKCGGDGVITFSKMDKNGYFNDAFFVKECPVCHGKGEVQTNEECLRSATFEELAGAIYEWYTLGYTRGKNGKKLNSITEVVEWLKQPHTFE